MPQLHLYVPDEVARLVRQSARARKMTVSGYLAELVRDEVATGWPADFFEVVVGPHPPGPREIRTTHWAE